MSAAKQTPLNSVPTVGPGALPHHPASCPEPRPDYNRAYGPAGALFPQFEAQIPRLGLSPTMARPLSLFSVSAILILGESCSRAQATLRFGRRLLMVACTAIDDGSRIITKYYSNPHPPAGSQTDYPGQIAYKTVKDQKAFEKGLLGLSSRAMLASSSCVSDSECRENGKADDRHNSLRPESDSLQDGVGRDALCRWRYVGPVFC